MAAARAVLQGPPGAAGPELAESARLFGLRPPDPAPAPQTEVWAENWPAVSLFMAMQTQLRFSFAGVEGFDYAALPVVERRLGLTRDEASGAFWGLQVMEVALIRHFNQQG